MAKNSQTVGAIGHIDHSGLTMIAVRMPQAMFDELKARAIKNDLSISGQIRDDVDTMAQVEKDMGE